jgi:hypothetical protein
MLRLTWGLDWNGAVLNGSVGFDTVTVGGLSVSHQEFAVPDSIAGANGNGILSGLLVRVKWVFFGLTLPSFFYQGLGLPQCDICGQHHRRAKSAIRSVLFHCSQAEEAK